MTNLRLRRNSGGRSTRASKGHEQGTENHDPRRVDEHLTSYPIEEFLGDPIHFVEIAN
jgi:hypothetical protein